MCNAKGEWRLQFLADAASRLYVSDLQLITGQQERAVTARLAFHLEAVLTDAGYLGRFPMLNVDPEYMRQGFGTDEKLDPDGKHKRPDIIVHQRGIDDWNVAMIEGKMRKARRFSRERISDLRKLQSFKSPPKSYAYAYFVVFHADRCSIEEV